MIIKHLDETNSSIVVNRRKEIHLLASYFKQDLAPLKIESAVIFGSATNDELFNPDRSDVDIVAYSKEFSLSKIEECIDIINKVGGNFLDKSPIFLCDFISPRIEFLYKINDVIFDINIFPWYFHGYENIETTATHDSIDLVIGAMYENAINIFGISPIEEIIKKTAIPFYNDEIRLKRMDELVKRIVKLNCTIEDKILKENVDVLNILYKSRGYFLKFLFIKNRKYPIDLNNYIYYQLKNYLNMNEKNINILLFKGDSILNIAKNYINFVSRELNGGNFDE